MDPFRFRALPPWAEDRITTDVVIHLDWRGRLRALLQGQATVRVNVTTEHKPGRMESESGIQFPHWCWPWHRHLELGCVAPPPPAPPPPARPGPA